MPEQVNMPKGDCDPTASPCKIRLLAGHAAPWREQGKSVKSPPLRRKKQRRQHVTTRATPVPCPLCHCGGEGREKIRNKVKSGKKGGWEEGVFEDLVYSSLSYSDLPGNKLN